VYAVVFCRDSFRSWLQILAAVRRRLTYGGDARRGAAGPPPDSRNDDDRCCLMESENVGVGGPESTVAEWRIEPRGIGDPDPAAGNTFGAALGSGAGQD